MEEAAPIETYRFDRGKATRALTEAGVMDEAGVVQVIMPLQSTLATLTQ
jgi:hypothetical protein